MIGAVSPVEAVITSEDATTGKPGPGGYLAGCRALGADPHTVIDDSRVGVAAVKAAGMYCVAVSSTVPQRLLDAADVVIQDGRDLFAWP